MTKAKTIEILRAMSETAMATAEYRREDGDKEAEAISIHEAIAYDTAIHLLTKDDKFTAEMERIFLSARTD